MGPGPARQVPAIVVGHVDFGERDRIVRLLTPDLGRVACLARGARGSRRRFAGVLDTGNRLQAVVRPGRGELWHIDEATLEQGRAGARSDLLRLTMLAYACELCGGLARELQPEPRLFGLLDMAALLLDAMTGPPGAAFRAGLEAKALTFAGLSPALTTCTVCGLAVTDPAGSVGFEPARGGAVHRHCRPGLRPVSADWLAAVEHARRSPLRDLVDLVLPPGPAWALAEAIEAQLNRALNSRRVLAPLEALQAHPPRSSG